MKKLFVLLLIVGGVSSAFITKETKETVAGAGGIEFKTMTLEEAKKEANATGKIIFIDCYTEWCGPCKRMAATAFVDESVGKLFNSKFINLKIEMEKNADGPELARTYSVKAYPTLIFIDGNGKLTKSVVGMQTAEQLLAVGKSI
ncbi:MAG: thioredoxin family protein [Bacteroidota bacterium]